MADVKRYRSRDMSLTTRRKAAPAFDFACFVIDKLREGGLPGIANCVKRWFEQYDERRKEQGHIDKHTAPPPRELREALEASIVEIVRHRQEYQDAGNEYMAGVLLAIEMQARAALDRQEERVLCEEVVIVDDAAVRGVIHLREWLINKVKEGDTVRVRVTEEPGEDGPRSAL